jgi:hypothetical protein
VAALARGAVQLEPRKLIFAHGGRSRDVRRG